MSTFSLDRFWQACGAVGPLRLAVEHAGAAETYVLPQPFALAGGDPRADVRPAGMTLHRRCAYLQVLGGRLLGLDLAAGGAGRKGGYPPHAWLDPGVAWPCGPLMIRLAADAPAPRPL